MKYLKITSDDPLEYELLDDLEVIIGYGKYLIAVSKSQFGNNNIAFAKTVQEWLATEI